MRAGNFVAASDIAEAAAADLFPCYGGNGLRGYTKSFTHVGRYSLIGRQGALCGNVRLFDGRFHATEHALVVSPKHGVETDWLYYALGLLALNQYSIGQAQPGLSVQVLGKVPIASPPDSVEQNKIADCLTSLDEVIAAQGRKVAALAAHKRGLMQQLFPREGETVPRYRFPEFRDTGQWDERPLGQIAEIKLGKMLSGDKQTAGVRLPYLNNISVRWNDINTSNLPEMYFEESDLERFGLRAGDVLVCEGGEPGRSAVWDGRLPDLKFQKAIHRVRFKIPFVPHLLVSYLESIAGTDRFEMLFTGGGIKHLTKETFAELRIPHIPIVEQHRIAACLSALDARVAAESAKLDGLKTHKKGLMQQLFPSADGGAAHGGTPE